VRIRAVAHERRLTPVRDLSCFGRPARLVWRKRRWRCVDVDCDAKTWTETSEHLDAQVVLTRRAGAEACRQVGELARPVSKVAEEFGVCWSTVMNAVIEHGTPLVDDPARVGRVRHLGVDETSFLRANRWHHTIYATGLVDLQRSRLIDMVKGNSAKDPRAWCAGRTRPGSQGSGSSPLIWPSRIGPGCHRIWTTPDGSRIRSTWCRSRTGVWTRYAAESRTTPLGTGAAKTTRCTGSASSC
jgi:hypothetical protein